jgi:membrane protease YdiL (CAAX protease family)
VALCAALLVRRPVGDTLGLTRGHLSVKSTAVLVIGTAGISHLLDWGIRSLGFRGGGVLETIEGALASASGWTLLLCLLGVAITPGIAEELLFRGLLMRSLARSAGVAVGIGVSALLFGALHADLVQGCAAAVLGLYLGTVAFASGSTRTSMACHIANNLAAVLAAAWGSDHTDAGSALTLLILATGGAFAGLVALWGALPAATSAWRRAGEIDRASG